MTVPRSAFTQHTPVRRAPSPYEPARLRPSAEPPSRARSSQGRPSQERSSQGASAVERQRAVTFCSLDTLRARGWTPGLIRALLGGPDRTEPMELYLTSRVDEAERDPVFARTSTTRRRRGEALRRAADRRRERALEAVRTAPMKLPRLSPGELARRAVEHRNVRDAQRAADSWGHVPSPATVDTADPAALARWQVRYLYELLGDRHSLLEALPTTESRDEGTRVLRGRMYGAIAAAYPALAGECRRRAAAEAGGRPAPTPSTARRTAPRRP
ncbi:hypothetical protein [Streptomyces daliensis]